VVFQYCIIFNAYSRSSGAQVKTAVCLSVCKKKPEKQEIRFALKLTFRNFKNLSFECSSIHISRMGSKVEVKIKLALEQAT